MKHRIHRRRFLRAGSAALVSASLTAELLDARLLAEESAPAVKPTMHVYPSYGWLRGLGIVPSWGENIVEAWQLYDGARFRDEVALARQVHCNCIRLWIEHAAWRTDPTKITERFFDAVAGIAENGMKVMPCLFNRWRDKQLDYGGSNGSDPRGPQLEYVRTLVQPLVGDDRILMWELCNEPSARERTSPEYLWLADIAAAVRSCGPKQPITIGTMSGTNITNYAPLVDVLNGHPYAHNPPNLEVLIASFQAMSKELNKPFICNETIPGALDDQVRAKVARFYTEMLSAAGFGWMGWVIREGKAIATSRERHDRNGINGGGYHPFFTKEGKLRDGLEFLTESPKLRAPWESA